MKSFHKPAEFDPSLFQASAKSNYVTRQAQLADELGLDLEADSSGSSDGNADDDDEVKATKSRIEQNIARIQAETAAYKQLREYQVQQQEKWRTEHKEEQIALAKRRKSYIAEMQLLLEAYGQKFTSKDGTSLDLKAIIEQNPQTVFDTVSTARANNESAILKAKLEACLSEAKKLRAAVRESKKLLTVQRQLANPKSKTPSDLLLAHRHRQLAELPNLKAELATLEKESVQNEKSNTKGKFADAQTKANLQAEILKLKNKLQDLSHATDKAADQAARDSAKRAAEDENNAKLLARQKEADEKQALLVQAQSANSQNIINVNSQLQKTKQSLLDTLSSREKELTDLKDKIKEKFATASVSTATLRDEKAKLLAEFNALKKGIEDLRKERLALEVQSEAKASSAREQRSKILQSLREVSSLRATLIRAKAALVPDTSALVQSTGEQLLKSVTQFQKKQQKVETELQANLRSEQDLRRKYFNQVQELLGNVRVNIRVRPLQEGEPEDKKVVKITGDETVVVLSDGVPRAFEFESKILGPDVDNEQVFRDLMVDLISAALDNHVVNVFSIGSRSSGKTHTMWGEEGLMAMLLARAPVVASRVSPAEASLNLSFGVHQIQQGIFVDLLTGRPCLPTEVKYTPIESVDEATRCLREGFSNRRPNASSIIQTIEVKGRHHLLETDFSAHINLVELDESMEDVLDFVHAKTSKKKSVSAPQGALAAYLAPFISAPSAKLLLLLHLHPCESAASISMLQMLRDKFA